MQASVKMLTPAMRILRSRKRAARPIEYTRNMNDAGHTTKEFTARMLFIMMF